MENTNQSIKQNIQKTISQIVQTLSKSNIPIEVEEVNDKEEIEKMLLTLELSSRTDCGFIYDYYDRLYLLVGEVDVTTLREESDECTDKIELLIIPRTVPTILGLISVDENPEFESYVQIFVFDGKKWISISMSYVKEYKYLFEQFTRIW